MYTATTGEVSLYVDNQKQATTATASALWAANSSFNVCRAVNNSKMYTGAVESIQVWQGVLSNDEVVQLP